MAAVVVAASAPAPPGKKRDVEAPISLGGFFAEDGDGEEDADGNETYEANYEVTEVEMLGTVFHVRQFAWHRANANKVWPGTFNLAEYLDTHRARYADGPIVELGAATGALTLFMASRGFHVTTSDIDDGGEVAENIAHNFALNGLPVPRHVPHTWGDGWPSAVSADQAPLPRFRFVVASDILLYVSAYPALVTTLCELFGVVSTGPGPGTGTGAGTGQVPGDCAAPQGSQGSDVEEFLMSWNRRIAASKEFFDRMDAAGFTCVHQGKCIYSFTRTRTRPRPPPTAAIAVAESVP
jgi:hypothetical protein